MGVTFSNYTKNEQNNTKLILSPATKLVISRSTQGVLPVVKDMDKKSLTELCSVKIMGNRTVLLLHLLFCWLK
jgi:hypothetical protein